MNLLSVFQSSISQHGDITRQALRLTTGVTRAVTHEMHPHIKPTDDFNIPAAATSDVLLTAAKLILNTARSIRKPD